MLRALEEFRIRFGGAPLLLWFAALALLALWRAWRNSLRRDSPASEVLIASIAISSLAAYAAIALWYVSVPYYFDNAEPTIPAVAWLFHVGLPIYHDTASAERYAHIYGPFAFITHAWVLGWFGPGIRMSKAVGATAGLVTLALLYGLNTRRTGSKRGAALSGLAALVLLLFRNYSFWTRPDPLQIATVALSLALAAKESGGYASAMLAGAIAGIGWNLKFTGPLYSLPVLVLIRWRAGPKPAMAALAAGVVVTMAPFALFGNVSFLNYVVWVRASGETGLLIPTLRQNIQWALFLCVPLVLSYFAVPESGRAGGSEWRNTIAALFLGVCGIVVAGSKPGAGPYHLLPFVPVIIYMTAWHVRTSPLSGAILRPFAVWVVVAAAIALAQQMQFVTTVSRRAQLQDLDEIRRLAETHVGIVEMGYGWTESASFERPILVFRNNSYFLDQPAIREQQLQGFDIPAGTIEALARCRVNFWLIPRGETPFSGMNSYRAVLRRPLYTEDFRRTFMRTHRQVESTAHFDVWQCVANQNR